MKWILIAAVTVTSTGCASKYVQADVVNATGRPVSLVEVDYPSASFGVETLAAGARYHYKFKVLGGGETKVMWTDAAHKDHTVTGPTLSEGQTGNLIVTLHDDTAAWTASMKP